jgi:predicted dehydrogenase
MPGETRRNFLKTMGVATASLMATARSYARIAGANETIRVGVIGCGGMGLAHLEALDKMRESDNLTISAVCDVYDKRLQAAASRFSATSIKDYKQILDSKDIDYVLIATPEHWHHRMILDALDAGKHIYAEKPITHSIEEAQEVVKRMAGSPLKLQIGVQGMSDDSYRTAHDYIKNGALGKVVMAHIDYSRNYPGDFWAYPIDPDARPGVNLDWDAWLGPAPKVAWDPARFFQWRRYWDYSGGIATDLFIHRHTRIIRSVGLTFPDYVVATGGTWNFTDSVAEIPDTFNMQLDYPGGPTVLLVSSMANDTPIRHLIRGHKATLEFTREGFTITPQRAVQEAVIPGAGERLEAPGVVTHTKTGAEDVTLHHRNLLAAIREGEPLNCDHMLGYYGLVACNLGVLSFRRRKYIKWDPQSQKAVEI